MLAAPALPHRMARLTLPEVSASPVVGLPRPAGLPVLTLL